MALIFKKLKSMVLSLLLIIPIIWLSAGCSEDSNPVITYTPTGKSALIVAVENNDGLLYSEDKTLFQTFKSKMLPILSEIFGVPESAMADMSLNSIIETYGEPWQISEITKYAKGKYDTIITMHNETANLSNLKQYLEGFSSGGYTIDMVFCLHGNNNCFTMYNHEVCDISSFASYIKSHNIRLRALYQTCCNAGEALNKWASSGIYAVNGAVGINSVTLFSPGYFMEEWVNGASFEDAVNKAYQRDIDKIGTYNDRIPVKTYLLTPDNLKESISIFAGRDRSIKINQYLDNMVQ